MNKPDSAVAQKGRVICLARRSRLVRTSPSLTRVNHRSNLPGPPSAEFRFEMINRFLLSGDQMGLKSGGQ